MEEEVYGVVVVAVVGRVGANVLEDPEHQVEDLTGTPADDEGDDAQ